MASGHERSGSIFTLLHFLFHRRKPVKGAMEVGVKRTCSGGGVPHDFNFFHVCILQL